MQLSNEERALVCACLGIFSHVGYFIHGEHTLRAPLYAKTAILGPPAFSVLLTRLCFMTFCSAAQLIAIGCLAYLGGLFASILVYRCYFHSLCQFPGPKLAQCTQLYHFFKVKDKIDNFRHLARLHTDYGDYVRVGPNLLSVADPDIIGVMFDRRTRFEKADWYDIGHPLTNLTQIRDKALHDMRRRHGWDMAFTADALRDYDTRIAKYADQLVAQMRRRNGEVVDAARWFEWYSFDIMGDLAFGRAFGAVEKGQSHIYIDTMHETSPFPLGCLSTMPWAIQTMGSLIPDRLNPFMRLVRYSTECVEQQKKKARSARPDIITTILDKGPFFHDPKRDDLLLVGDARLLIIAGSDTTAAAITCAFYYLARDESQVRKLRAELEARGIRNDESFAVQRLQKLEFLNGFINETLRLSPPVPGGTFRNTPGEGVVIGGRPLPGGVKVIAPQYIIHRSPKAFKDPNKFIPERWTTRRQELILKEEAWFPFSTGKFACIGKQLALNEIRTVVAKMVLEFDIVFAEGETGRALLEESQDMFTMVMAKLNLCFIKRGQATYVGS
ncbi:cytochrome P450 monooxygenase-like protein [Biscogniauxia sp. FL1348]|nr:cytochrome P450 monooxygenase-like protein [Biscogniauxia sp. FL1348]